MTWAVRVHFGAELPNPMAMTRFTPLLCCLLAASSLLGCRTETPAPDDASERAASVTAQSLRMPESHFEGIRQIIEREGGQMSDVFKLVQYFRNLDHFPAYSQVRRQFFPGEPPVSTVVEVSAMLPTDDILIEVEATAYLPLGGTKES